MEVVVSMLDVVAILVFVPVLEVGACVGLTLCVGAGGVVSIAITVAALVLFALLFAVVVVPIRDVDGSVGLPFSVGVAVPVLISALVSVAVGSRGVTCCWYFSLTLLVDNAPFGTDVVAAVTFIAVPFSGFCCR